MKSLIIFDLDGTLLNTIADLGNATNHALACSGYPTHQLEEYPFFVGNGVRRLIERALPSRDVSPETVDRLLVDFKKYYGEHLYDLTTPYPGIPELLRMLSGKGINLAVASNKYQAAVDILIRHFFPDITWAAIEGQKEGIPVKPDPSIVFDIISKCPTPKSDILYVGDSGVDMETARRACVESAGVTWGFRPESELIQTQATHICTTTGALANLIL